MIRFRAGEETLAVPERGRLRTTVRREVTRRLRVHDVPEPDRLEEAVIRDPAPDPGGPRLVQPVEQLEGRTLHGRDHPDWSEDRDAMAVGIKERRKGAWLGSSDWRRDAEAGRQGE